MEKIPMSRYWHFLFMILSMLAVMLQPLEAGAADNPSGLDPNAILQKYDDLWRGTSSQAKMTMNIKTKNWSRTLSMITFSLGKDHSLVRVTQPLKDKDTVTLKVGKEIYNYLPNTDRTIKINSSMLEESWMGSHFTNDDLIKDIRMSEDYQNSITFQGQRDGQDIIEITSIPKPDRPIVWGKVVSVFRSSDQLPVSIQYFDEDGTLMRTMTLSGYKKFGDKTLPSELKMLPADKPGEYTQIVYDDIDFSVKLTPDFFSLTQLRRT